MNRRFAHLLFSSVFLFVLASSERTRAATHQLASCDEASLRAAIAQGGEILFDCAGTIVLTNTLVITNDVTLDANGRAVTLRGGGLARLFTVNSNASLTLSGLSLIGGRATNAGGAVLNHGSFLATNCRFSGNAANPGFVSVSDSGFAEGGAVWNGGVATLRSSAFRYNVAIGALRFWPGPSRGGAIFNSGILTISDVAFESNTAQAANGPITIGFVPTPDGAPGYGGAVHNSGTAVVLNSTFAFNSCIGGAGGRNASVSDRYGGKGGAGLGGGIFNEGNLAMTNCTWYANTTAGGIGGQDIVPARRGADGQGLGGGVANVRGAATLAFCTLAANTATNGGALFSSNASVVITHSILSHSPPNNNCAGPISDSGYNLSSDAPAGFSAPGTISNIDPLLGLLANNGGPTLTMSLLPGSPAINAGSESNCPATDQRGVARPAHGRCDIGAFELEMNEFRFTSIAKGHDGARLRGFGPPESSFSIQGSSQPGHWNHLSDAVVQNNGLFDRLVPANETHQFYRVARPGPGGVALP